MTLNTTDKTGNNNPLLAMMKSIFLLFLFFVGVNTHSALTKDTPNKTTVEAKAQTMPESVKAVLLAGVRDNNALQKRK